MATTAIAGQANIGGVMCDLTGEGCVNIGGILYPLSVGNFNIDGILMTSPVQGGVAISTLAVGSSVWMKINGVATEFVIAHHGKPSSLYDSSCSGTWLVTKNIYTMYTYAYSDPYTEADYAESAVHDYLNGTFLNSIESGVREIIKQVKIPYTYGMGDSGVVKSGSNGLSTKVFLLSAYEIFNNGSYKDGDILSYFDVATAERKKRAIGYYNGEATSHSLRTPDKGSTEWIGQVDEDGNLTEGASWTDNGIRPTLIVPFNASVNGSGFISGSSGTEPEPDNGYTFIEYIEADSGTYIDTEFVPNQDSRVIIDFKLDSYSNNNFCGCRRTTSSQAFAFSTVSSKWRFGYNNSSSASSIAADTNRHTVEINKNVCSLDGTVIDTNTYSTFEGYTTFTIFAIKASGTYEGSGRLYSCKLYDNGTLVRDLVPCINSSGEAGLYDKVSGAFYGSNGTGTIKTP